MLSVMTQADSPGGGAGRERFDLVIDDGLFFDGTGAPGQRRSLGIRDGRVAAIRPEPFGPGAAPERVDARGAWVMPGFVDIHTHYDAELEAAPALSESLRHGVTTVVVGSCSLGTVLSSPLDIADMFTRVEAIPRDHVLPLFEAKKTWSTPAEYRAHLDALPLGPNVAALLGHSDLRCSVMGLGRSVTRGERPSRDERARMERLVADALDAGFLGLSVNTNFWDKLGGDRHRSQPLPGAFASFGEIHALARLVRARGRVLQVIPNISAKYDALFFLAESTRLFGKPLRTSVVSLVDVRSSRMLYKVLALLARVTNRVFGGDMRFQALPSPFEMFVDGLDAPVFEEIGAGTAALHVQEMAARRELLRDPAYRAWFRRQWTSILAPRVYHRDFRCSQIVACPDATLVGRSFDAIARERGQDVVSVFLDLCAEHGDRLRWFTTIGNDRPDHLRRILSLPDVLVGFSDAGAHLRNMAFYNFPLFVLRMARDAAAQGLPFLPLERAVHRLTGEIGAWMGLDAGTLAVGSRADVVVVDPRHLDAIDALHEAPMPELGGFVRMVRRNDDAVPAVVVGGRLAAARGALRPGVGVEARFGRFLGAGERTPPRAAASPAAPLAPAEVGAAPLGERVELVA
jgi:N-acyl-D-aspartate/D-glutamate deacylase